MPIKLIFIANICFVHLCVNNQGTCTIPDYCKLGVLDDSGVVRNGEVSLVEKQNY